MPSFEVKFPARLVAQSPLSVTRSGGVYTLSIETNGLLGGGVWLGQMKHALRTLDLFDTVNDAVSADPSDAIRISWDSGWRTQKGDALYVFIKSKVGQVNADAAYELAPQMII